jgi:hypothetical protein
LLTNYCATCGKLKPLAEFHVDSRKPHGHKETCAECTNGQDRQRYAEATPEQKAERITRARGRRANARSLNWERVQQLLIEAVLWGPSAQAQDIGKQIEDMSAGAASKPLPRGGAPAAWDAIIDIRDLIRRTDGAEIACEVALSCERLDVVKSVLMPQAEATVEWCKRQRSPRRETVTAKRLLNTFHAEQRVLERKIEALRKRASYCRAMEHMARKLHAMGVR